MSRSAARGVLPGEPGRLAVPKLHCRYCTKPVPKGRRNWCSQDCIDEYRIRNDPGFARARVFERDHGVCSACGRDTEALALRVGAWLVCDWVLEITGSSGQLEHHKGDLFARAQRRRAFAYRFGIRMLSHWACPPWPGSDGIPRAGIRTLWEMDHVRPVVEGGGGCGLDNLRTLCCPCHKRASRELAARRAEQRRSARATTESRQPAQRSLF